ncbi:MAG: hypothetical protein LUH05_04220 [Candidatus Gastranaerophilales bacterium]|nr:hypothetical protein [Candidatus Gastranaerophilales bacterium]
MTMDGLTAADVAAITNKGYNYGNGYGFGGEWIWVIVLFVIFAFCGNGFNRNGNGLTQAELQQGFDTQSLLRGQEGIKNGLCDGFYAQNTTMLQGFAAANAAIAENRFAAQNCCCETNRNIDAVRYENAKNTCDIVTAINADGEKTRALMVQNTIQALRDKLADQNQALQTANFQLSQQAQSANIINTLRPVPQPAYITCSPYQAANFYNGFGGSGCGLNVV